VNGIEKLGMRDLLGTVSNTPLSIPSSSGTAESSTPNSDPLTVKTVDSDGLEANPVVVPAKKDRVALLDGDSETDPAKRDRVALLDGDSDTEADPHPAKRLQVYIRGN
jgi:hypothetical protein